MVQVASVGVLIAALAVMAGLGCWVLHRLLRG
jgi:hypothetical protein